MPDVPRSAQAQGLTVADNMLATLSVRKVLWPFPTFQQKHPAGLTAHIPTS